jgi:hypothetical protein
MKTGCWQQGLPIESNTSATAAGKGVVRYGCGKEVGAPGSTSTSVPRLPTRALRQVGS